jgi:hypothetical protein
LFWELKSGVVLTLCLGALKGRPYKSGFACWKLASRGGGRDLRLWANPA